MLLPWHFFLIRGCERAHALIGQADVVLDVGASTPVSHRASKAISAFLCGREGMHHLQRTLAEQGMLRLSQWKEQIA